MDPTQNSVIPYLTVENGKQAVRFYVEAFGAREVESHATPDGTKLIHASLSLNGGTIMLSDDFPEKTAGKSRTAKALGGTPVMISLISSDGDELWKRAVSAGATIVMPLADQYWGDRFGMLDDPFGLRWSISVPVRRPTPAELDAAAREHLGKA
jgi:PhnB protein